MKHVLSRLQFNRKSIDIVQAYLETVADAITNDEDMPTRATRMHGCECHASQHVHMMVLIVIVDDDCGA